MPDSPPVEIDTLYESHSMLKCLSYTFDSPPNNIYDYEIGVLSVYPNRVELHQLIGGNIGSINDSSNIFKENTACYTRKDKNGEEKLNYLTSLEISDTPLFIDTLDIRRGLEIQLGITRTLTNFQCFHGLGPLVSFLNLSSIVFFLSSNQTFTLLRYDQDHCCLRPLSFHSFQSHLGRKDQQQKSMQDDEEMPLEDIQYDNLTSLKNELSSHVKFQPKIKAIVLNPVIEPLRESNQMTQKLYQVFYQQNKMDDDVAKGNSILNKESSSHFDDTSHQHPLIWNLAQFSILCALHISEDQLIFLQLQLQPSSKTTDNHKKKFTEIELFGSHQFLQPDQISLQTNPWYLSISEDLKQHRLVDFAFLQDPNVLPITDAQSTSRYIYPTLGSTLSKNVLVSLLVNPCPVSETCLGWSLGQCSVLILSVNTSDRRFRIVHKVSPLPSNSYSILPLWLPTDQHQLHKATDSTSDIHLTLIHDSSCSSLKTTNEQHLNMLDGNRMPIPDKELVTNSLSWEACRNPVLLAPYIFILSPYAVGCIQALKSGDLSTSECFTLWRNSTKGNTSAESPQAVGLLSRKDSTELALLPRSVLPISTVNENVSVGSEQFSESVPNGYDHKQGLNKPDVSLETIQKANLGSSENLEATLGLNVQVEQPITEFFQVVNDKALLGPRVSEFVSLVCGGSKADPYLTKTLDIPNSLSDKIKGLLFLKRPIIDTSYLQLLLTEFQWLSITPFQHLLIPHQPSQVRNVSSKGYFIVASLTVDPSGKPQGFTFSKFYSTNLMVSEAPPAVLSRPFGKSSFFLLCSGHGVFGIPMSVWHLSSAFVGYKPQVLHESLRSKIFAVSVTRLFKFAKLTEMTSSAEFVRESHRFSQLGVLESDIDRQRRHALSREDEELTDSIKLADFMESSLSLGFPRDGIILPPISPSQPRPSYAVTSGAPPFSRLIFIHPSLSSISMASAQATTDSRATETSIIEQKEPEFQNATGLTVASSLYATASAEGLPLSSAFELEKRPSVQKCMDSLVETVLEAGAFIWTVPLGVVNTISKQSIVHSNTHSYQSRDSEMEGEQVNQANRKRLKLSEDAVGTSEMENQNEAGQHGLVVVSSDPNVDIGRTYIIDMKSKRRMGKIQNCMTSKESLVNNERDLFSLICRPTDSDLSNEIGFDMESSTLACGIICSTNLQMSSCSNVQTFSAESNRSFIVQVTTTEIRCIDLVSGKKLIAPAINLLDRNGSACASVNNPAENQQESAEFHSSVTLPILEPSSSFCNLSDVNLLDAPLAVQAVVASPWVVVLFENGIIRFWTVKENAVLLKSSRNRSPSRNSMTDINDNYDSNTNESDLIMTDALLVPVSSYILGPYRFQPLIYINSCFVPKSISTCQSDYWDDGYRHMDFLQETQNSMHKQSISLSLPCLILVPQRYPTRFLLFSLETFDIIFSADVNPQIQQLEIRNLAVPKSSISPLNSSSESLVMVQSPHSCSSKVSSLNSHEESDLRPTSTTYIERSAELKERNPLDSNSLNTTIAHRIISAEVVLIDPHDSGPTLILMLHGCPLMIFRAYRSDRYHESFPECHFQFPFRFQRTYRDLTLVTGSPSLDNQLQSAELHPTKSLQQLMLRPFPGGPSTVVIYSQAGKSGGNNNIEKEFYRSSRTSCGHTGSVAVSVIPVIPPRRTGDSSPRQVVKQVIFLAAHRNRLFIHLASPEEPDSLTASVASIESLNAYASENHRDIPLKWLHLSISGKLELRAPNPMLGTIPATCICLWCPRPTAQVQLLHQLNRLDFIKENGVLAALTESQLTVEDKNLIFSAPSSAVQQTVIATTQLSPQQNHQKQNGEGDQLSSPSISSCTLSLLTKVPKVTSGVIKRSCVLVFDLNSSKLFEEQEHLESTVSFTGTRTMTPTASFEFPSTDRGISLRFVRLEGTDLLAVGTSVTTEKSESENLGRLYLFNLPLAEKYKPHRKPKDEQMLRTEFIPKFSQLFGAPVFCISYVVIPVSDGTGSKTYILHSSGSKLFASEFERNELVRGSFVETPSCVVTISSIKSYLLVGDATTGVHFIMLRPQERGQPGRRMLSCLSRKAPRTVKFGNVSSVAAEYLANGQTLHILESDTSGEIEVSEYSIGHSTTTGIVVKPMATLAPFTFLSSLGYLRTFKSGPIVRLLRLTLPGINRFGVIAISAFGYVAAILPKRC